MRELMPPPGSCRLGRRELMPPGCSISDDGEDMTLAVAGTPAAPAVGEDSRPWLARLALCCCDGGDCKACGGKVLPPDAAAVDGPGAISWSESARSSSKPGNEPMDCRTSSCWLEKGDGRGRLWS